MRSLLASICSWSRVRNVVSRSRSSAVMMSSRCFLIFLLASTRAFRTPRMSSKAPAHPSHYLTLAKKLIKCMLKLKTIMISFRMSRRLFHTLRSHILGGTSHSYLTLTMNKVVAVASYEPTFVEYLLRCVPQPRKALHVHAVQMELKSCPKAGT
jgi:hypothetical protein